jgi:hypothetical protein
MANFIQLIDVAPQPSHNPSQQIYAFHFNSWQLLRTNRHTQAGEFAGHCSQMELAVLRAQILTAEVTQLIESTSQQSQNPSQQPRNPPQQIYALHFSPRQLLRTNRHI